jgi:hypothetical protein
VTKLTVFIDEGGDSGANDGIRFYPGRHEWFTLAAVVVRSSNEPKTVNWVASLRDIANSHQGHMLHYQRVALARRVPLCVALSELPVRGFVVASHKSNLREYENPKLGHMTPAVLYNFCCRLLFERIMSWADGLIRREAGEREPIEFVFSRLGGHNYDKMFSYLEKCSMQRRTGGAKLPFKEWIPELLDHKKLIVEPAQGRAGLQLSDVVASAFYQAANTISPNFSIEPALALKPIIPASKLGTEADLGVTVWPLRHQAPLPIESRAIFEGYGYSFA